MGFFDRFKKKGEQATEAPKEKDSNQPETTGKRVKKYTSDGKPIYE
jgi:hypothetical protein